VAGSCTRPIPSSPPTQSLRTRSPLQILRIHSRPPSLQIWQYLLAFFTLNTDSPGWIAAVCSQRLAVLIRLLRRCSILFHIALPPLTPFI
jgi:hypothetical protein